MIDMNLYKISSLPQQIFEAPTNASNFEDSYLETAEDVGSISSIRIRAARHGLRKNSSSARQ